MRALRGGDILIVGMDAVWSQAFLPSLEQGGHHVVRCDGLQEARSNLERFPFDVVLSAESLHDGKGRFLGNWIKSNPDFPDLQRVSFALLTHGEMITQTVADDTNLPLASRRGFLGGLLRNPRAESTPAPQIIGESTRFQPEEKLLPPDDIIAATTPVVELMHRVQILLRLRRYLDEISNTVSTLMGIAEGIEEQDKRARGHCRRLSIMALELGTVMGCDEWQLTALERAAYLHDVGKVAIPGALISKSETLTPREMEIIQTHCTLGEKLCQPVAALAPVLPIIRHHHERSNGTGYPDGLHGEDIPILAQILSIPDIYDALRMWRPYRPPMIEVQAIVVMRQEVSQGFWNRHIFDAFISHVLPGLDERLDSYHVLWPPAA